LRSGSRARSVAGRIEERLRADGSGYGSIGDLHLDPRFIGDLAVHHRETDRGTERVAVCAARHVTDALTTPQDRLTVPEHRSGIVQTDRHESPVALRLPRGNQRVATEEPFLPDMHREPEAGLVRVVGEAHVVSPRAEAALEAEGIERECAGEP